MRIAQDITIAATIFAAVFITPFYRLKPKNLDSIVDSLYSTTPGGGTGRAYPCTDTETTPGAP